MAAAEAERKRKGNLTGREIFMEVSSASPCNACLVAAHVSPHWQSHRCMALCNSHADIAGAMSWASRMQHRGPSQCQVLTPAIVSPAGGLPGAR